MKDKDTHKLEEAYQIIWESNTAYDNSPLQKKHYFVDDNLTIDNYPNAFSVEYDAYWDYKDDSDMNRETGYGPYNEPTGNYSHENITITEFNKSGEPIRTEKEIQIQDNKLFLTIEFYFPQII